MGQPGRKLVASKVLHRPQFGLDPQSVRNPPGRALIIGRERNVHTAVFEDGLGGAVGFFDLVQRLGNQEGGQV